MYNNEYHGIETKFFLLQYFFFKRGDYFFTSVFKKKPLLIALKNLIFVVTEIFLPTGI